ncbi:MAG: hypothetical protein HFI15_16700 [Lachnospiraceae bacterium]|nr:hypothetical protein [Lachnospiraceae bacterium]
MKHERDQKIQKGTGGEPGGWESVWTEETASGGAEIAPAVAVYGRDLFSLEMIARLGNR